MKRIILSVILTMAVGFVSAQIDSFNGKKVRFVCDVSKVAAQFNQTKTNVYEQGGYVFIPANKYKNTGSKGLLIFHDEFQDEYYAFDQECQQCVHDGNKGHIYMKTEVTCRCSICGSEFQNISIGSAQQTNKSGNYWLVQYICYLKGNRLLVTNETIYDELF